ncbi:hypothetical protein [Saccharothrix sp. ALI-22-I]|uniref:hypothetical protein n=1 Tax=Saccharothrix sp. ALI-22-I TaxID=1933778 RepID=UPI00117A5A26|nr:hypothetical protein [Saccharothrix sp. ALI-22-I]
MTGRLLAGAASLAEWDRVRAVAAAHETGLVKPWARTVTGRYGGATAAVTACAAWPAVLPYAV